MRQPPVVRSARTVGGPDRRMCAKATAPRASPLASGAAHRCLNGTFAVPAAARDGDPCWVATNHTAPLTAAMRSTLSRATAGATEGRPGLGGAVAVKKPASARAARWSRRTPSRSIAAACSSNVASTPARSSSTASSLPGNAPTRSPPSQTPCLSGCGALRSAPGPGCAACVLALSTSSNLGGAVSRRSRRPPGPAAAATDPGGPRCGRCRRSTVWSPRSRGCAPAPAGTAADAVGRGPAA